MATNQVGNYNNSNFRDNFLDPNYQLSPFNPNYQQNKANYYTQQINTNQPMYINVIDMNAARKRVMIITDNWRTREPMDGKWRAGFWDCCWRQKAVRLFVVLVW